MLAGPGGYRGWAGGLEGFDGKRGWGLEEESRVCSIQRLLKPETDPQGHGACCQSIPRLISWMEHHVDVLLSSHLFSLLLFPMPLGFFLILR